MLPADLSELVHAELRAISVILEEYEYFRVLPALIEHPQFGM